MNSVKLTMLRKTTRKLNIRYTMYNVACTFGNFDYRSFFSCPVSTRLLYIVGSNSSCLWSPFEIDIQNRIDDELSEFTWFNEETSTSGKRLTTPCSNSEIESSVTIVSITWWLFFPVEWNRAWKKKLQCNIIMWPD